MGWGGYSANSFYLTKRASTAFNRVTHKPVKRIHKVDQVIHIWAQRINTNGESHKGNVFFEGDRLFDYGHHFCLGQFVTNAKGELACFLNSNSHSSTTSGHQGQTERAVPPGIPTFAIPGAGYNSRLEWPDAHAIEVPGILESYIARAKEHAGKSQRCRKEWAKSHHVEQAESLLVEASEFAAFFEHPFSPPALDNLAKLDAADKKEAARQERERAELERERTLEAFQRWQAGTSHYCPSEWSTDDKGGIRMRIVGDMLQTSRGAEVPLKHAIKVFQFIKKVRANGTDWNRNGRTIRVGHYQVDSIKANGDFTAGCHFFTWAQVEAAAKAAGVLDIAPGDTTESSQVAA